MGDMKPTRKFRLFASVGEATLNPAISVHKPIFQQWWQTQFGSLGQWKPATTEGKEE